MRENCCRQAVHPNLALELRSCQSLAHLLCDDLVSMAPRVKIGFDCLLQAVLALHQWGRPPINFRCSLFWWLRQLGAETGSGH